MWSDEHGTYMWRIMIQIVQRWLTLYRLIAHKSVEWFRHVSTIFIFLFSPPWRRSH